MSVILFGQEEVYTDMANAYESLKFLLDERGTQQEKMDTQFYSAMRYLYFANVAAWLATYHDCTPLPASELACIETFDDFKPGRRQFPNNHLPHLHKMVSAWGRLKYNLVTNGGEMYRPVESYDFIQHLIERLTREVLERAQKEDLS